MSAPLYLLRQIPFFQDLPLSDLNTIAEQAHLGIAKANQEIISAGTVVNFLSFVISGQLQLTEFSTHGRATSIQNVGAGDIVGLASCLDQLASTHSIFTLSESHLLVLPVVQARLLMQQRPILAERVNQILVKTLRFHLQERSALASANAYQRLFSQIDLLTRQQAQAPQTIPRQQDLAQILSISRETVSRGLQLLIKHKVVSKIGHQLVINQPETLALLAAQGIEILAESPSQPHFVELPEHS